MSVRQVDLNDAATFVAGAPHDWFAWLREHDPVHWNPQPGGGGFWAVTRYDDVVSVSREPGLFSSWRGSALLADLPPDDLEGMRLQLIHMDPPERLRSNFINGIKHLPVAFTPAA